MSLSKKPYKGTRDFFPKERRVRDYIFSNMSKAAQLYGYEPYDGPLLEEVELYRAKSGEELINDQIYSFQDRGKREVAIRPEMTPTVARMVANIHRESSKPIRWFSIPNLMRYEKPQRGRLREHWQFNCDIFGAKGRYGEIEILQVAIKLLTSLGATKVNFEILVNDREVVDCVFSKIIGADSESTYKLYKIVDKAKKVPEEALSKMISELNLSSEQVNAFQDYIKIKNFNELESYLKKHAQNEVLESFKEFIELTNNSNITDYLVFDPTIVRGLDYYTGIVFEIFDKHPDNRRAICGGGAYANLLQIFNESPLPGVGFGLGDVTLCDFLETHKLMPDFTLPENDLFISVQNEKYISLSMKVAEDLRNKDLKVVTSLDKLNFKKVFKAAEKQGARFVAFLDENEIQNNEIQIKSMSTKEQFNINLDDIEKISSTIKNN